MSEESEDIKDKSKTCNMDPCMVLCSPCLCTFVSIEGCCKYIVMLACCCFHHTPNSTVSVIEHSKEETKFEEI